MNESHFNGYLHVRNRARQLRREPTEAERVLWEYLRGRRCEGYRFLRQRPVWQYVLDFYCPALHVGVEVDGNIHDTEGVWQYDSQREANLAEWGITLVHLTNDEVLQTEPTALYRRILRAVGK